MLRTLQRWIGGLATRAASLAMWPTGALVTSADSWTFKAVIKEAYKRNPYMYAALRWIRGGAKAVGLTLNYRGEKVEPTDIPEQLRPLKKLLKNPNPNQSWDELTDALIDHLYCAGAAYLRVFGVGFEEGPLGRRVFTSPRIYLLKPDQVNVIEGEYDIVGFKYRKTLGGMEDVPAEQILYLRFSDPENPLRPLSPVRAAAEPIDFMNSAIRWATSLLKNLGVPAGIVFLKGIKAMTKEKRREVEEDLRKRYGGPDNAGSIAVMSGESAGFQQLSVTPKDTGWTEGKLSAMREICAVMGVPSVLLGDPNARTYSNIEAAQADLYENTILPLYRFIINKLQDWLLPLMGLSTDEVLIELDTSQVRALSENVATLVTRLKEADWLTINEKRSQYGEQTLDDPRADSLFWREDEAAVVAAQDRAIRAGEIGDPVLFHQNSLYPTLASRARLIKKVDKLRDKWTKEMQGSLTRYFAGQEERVVDWLLRQRGELTYTPTLSLRDGGGWYLPAFNDTVEGEAYAEEIGPTEAALIIEFGQDAINELKAEGILFDAQHPEWRRWLANELASRSSLINETTAERLKEILSETQYEPTQTAVKAIRQEYADISRSRAVTIARTETTRAATEARTEGFAQLEQKLARKITREWVSARDGKVRPDHQICDGKLEDTNGMFDTPVGAVRGPGMDGPPGFVCNCRCTVAGLFTDMAPI